MFFEPGTLYKSINGLANVELFYCINKNMILILVPKSPEFGPGQSAFKANMVVTLKDPRFNYFSSDNYKAFTKENK